MTALSRRTALAVVMLAATACSGTSNGLPDAVTDLVETVSSDIASDVAADSVLPDAVPADAIAVPVVLEVIAPALASEDQPFPVVVRVPGNPFVDIQATGEVLLSVDLTGEALGQVPARRGAGSASVIAEKGFDGTLVAQGLGGSGQWPIIVGAIKDGQVLEGTLAGEQLEWSSSVLVTGDVVVPEGSTLTILPGTMVRLVHKANIIVHGRLECIGTKNAPIWLRSETTDQPWGGIIHDDAEGLYHYTFLTGGGGDPAHVFGHSGSQAVLFVEDGVLDLDNVFLLDNAGKALGARQSKVTVSHSLISRCDTGGELEHTLAQITDTHFLEMPNADGEPVDDDNDGIYLLGVHADVEANEPGSVIRRCVFGIGKDDAIDHNGAALEVSDTIIEDFHHEGVACSSANRARITNTLVTGCGQGIEAGYGSPEVIVEHCTLVENGVGVRLGDSYEKEVSGTISVTNSIAVLNTDHNVWNFSRKDSGPLDDAVAISHSMVNMPEWDAVSGNLPGLPVFNAAYRLAPDSPGIKAGSDGQDMGIVGW